MAQILAVDNEERMCKLIKASGIKINKICFDHTTVKDLYDLPKADLTITDYPMVWARLIGYSP
jgi:hypothetical protein